MAPHRAAFVPGFLFAAAFAVGCSEQRSAAPAPPIDAGPPAAVAGTYRVRGATSVIGSTDSREISGLIILTQDGDSFRSSFDLDTIYPGPTGALRAEVIGTGEGIVKGTTLEGTARTQIVASQVPGIDTAFAMMPTAFGVRIASKASGTVTGNRIEIHIESQAEPGHTYIPTRTSLRGARLASPSAAVPPPGGE